MFENTVTVCGEFFQIFNLKFEKIAGTLENGQVIDVGKERFMCPELLLQPDLIGEECGGVHKLVYDSIRAYLRGC